MAQAQIVIVMLTGIGSHLFCESSPGGGVPSEGQLVIPSLKDPAGSHEFRCLRKARVSNNRLERSDKSYQVKHNLVF